MKYNPEWKDTYLMMVKDAVKATLADLGDGEQFTIKEFAERHGFRLTWNLRRRFAELVEAGELARSTRYLESGRLGHVYHKPAREAGQSFDMESAGVLDARYGGY